MTGALLTEEPCQGRGGYSLKELLRPPWGTSVLVWSVQSLGWTLSRENTPRLAQCHHRASQHSGKEQAAFPGPAFVLQG